MTAIQIGLFVFGGATLVVAGIAGLPILWRLIRSPNPHETGR